MPEILEFSDADKFLEKYEELKEAGTMFIVYLTGGIGEDGKSWCPDCEAHKNSI